MLVVVLLTVEQCTTAAIQGNYIVLKEFNSNSFIIETNQDKRCTSPTPNITTNTPYIQILQGCDDRDGIQGPPGLAGTPGRDGTNGKNDSKGDEGDLDHKDLQDQETEVWSLLDGDVPSVLQTMIQNYSTKGKLPGVILLKLEVELTTFVYLINLSFYPIHLVYLSTNPTFMEQSMMLMVVLSHHVTNTTSPVLYVMFPLEYHI